MSNVNIAAIAVARVQSLPKPVSFGFKGSHQFSGQSRSYSPNVRYRVEQLRRRCDRL